PLVTRDPAAHLNSGPAEARHGGLQLYIAVRAIYRGVIRGGQGYGMIAAVHAEPRHVHSAVRLDSRKGTGKLPARATYSKDALEMAQVDVVVCVRARDRSSAYIGGVPGTELALG